MISAIFLQKQIRPVGKVQNAASVDIAAKNPGALHNALHGMKPVQGIGKGIVYKHIREAPFL